MTRSRMRAAASLTPANATLHRPAVTGMMRRVRSASTATTAPAARTVAKSALMCRAATARISTVMTVHREATAAMPARPRVFRTGNSATRSPTRRGKAAERSGPIPRAARVSARTATARGAIARIRRARRAIAIGRAGIGPSGNSAATRNFPRAARRTADRARISAAGIARAARGTARAARGIAVSRNRGRSAMRLLPIMSGVTPARPAVTTSRARTAAARSVRDFRVRARIARKASARFASGRNSIVRARTVRSSSVRARVAPGRSTRAAMPTGRAATTRTTARFSSSVPRSVAAAPIVSASRISRSARPGRRARKVRRADCKSAVAGGAGLAPRRRGMDRAGPRHRQRPRHQLAGA